MEATVVRLGDEWGMVAFPHEMFCQYELWVDENAPFKHNMTLGMTNGCTGYVPDDEALSMGTKGGYEASCLPRLGGLSTGSKHYNPPAVGAEKIIKNLVSTLWNSY